MPDDEKPAGDELAGDALRILRETVADGIQVLAALGDVRVVAVIMTEDEEAHVELAGIDEADKPLVLAALRESATRMLKLTESLDDPAGTITKTGKA